MTLIVFLRIEIYPNEIARHFEKFSVEFARPINGKKTFCRVIVPELEIEFVQNSQSNYFEKIIY